MEKDKKRIYACKYNLNEAVTKEKKRKEQNRTEKTAQTGIGDIAWW